MHYAFSITMAVIEYMAYATALILRSCYYTILLLYINEVIHIRLSV